MTLESILFLLLDNLPEDVTLDFPIPDFKKYVPTQIELFSMLKFLGIFAAGFLILGIIGRIFRGKRSGLNHALSSGIGILFIYAVTVVFYTFRPWNLDQYLSPLPFVGFASEYLAIFPFSGAVLHSICYEILSMLILAFLVNLVDTMIAEGENIVGWFILRLVSVLVSMVIHLAVRWLIARYLPDVLNSYAPMILLGVLAAMMLLGILNVVLGAVLTAVEPILGAIYTFFFSSMIGRQLTKAVLTTAVLTILAILLEHFGFILINISESALIAYAPLLIGLMILWYVIGHLL